MRKIFILLLAVTMIVLSGGVASAGPIIYDNGDTNYAVGPYIDSFENGYYEAADDFELSSGSVIADVHFTGFGYHVYDGGPIQWTIYNDDENGFYHPGSVFDTGLALNIQTTDLGSDFFDVSFDLDHLVTWTGLYGWLGLHMPGEDGNVSWAETASYGSPSWPVYGVAFVSGEWIEWDSDLAFKLTTVPEPATLLLLGSGLVGLGLFRKKFRKK